MMDKSLNRPSKSAIFFPLAFIILNLIIMTGLTGAHLSMKAGVLIHFVSFITLGIAFEIPEFSLNVWCLCRSADRGTFVKSFDKIKGVLHIRYILTHFIAPCSGITVMASGLFLVHRGGYSFETGWLFWIMVTAAIGLYKGMYQHNLFIRRLWAYCATADPAEDEQRLRRAIRSPVDQILIFLEFPTYVFNYAAAYYKLPLANPLTEQIRQADITFRNGTTAGFLIILGGALLLPILRFLIRRFSQTQLLLAN